MALKGSANFGPRGSTALGFGGHAHRAFPIVNRISKVFGNIGFEYQPFQFETESEQLKEDNWIGRAWRCPNFIIRLEKLKGYANLCLIISPLAEQSAQTA